MIRVSSLKKNPKNPRQIKGEKLELLKKSVASFQKMMALRPMIVDENNIVLGGNMRLAAIKALGLKEIPDDWVKRADDLSEDEKAEFVIKDNNSFGEYDWDAIANEWDAFPLSDWGLDVPGFEAVEEVGEADAEPQIDKAAELNKKWKVKSGDLWQIGEHRLLCGSSMSYPDVGTLIQHEVVKAIITDPPYGVDYSRHIPNPSKPKLENDEKCHAAELMAYLPTAEAIYVFSRWDVLTEWQLTMPYPVRNVIVWDKQLHGMGDLETTYAPSWEACIFASHSGHKLNGGRMRDVWSIQREVSDYHATPKPVEIIQIPVEKSTKPGDIVYEPFAGSGTTLVACQNLNRKCYAIEISENYCAVILERMATAFPDIEIKRIDQATAAKT